jgi:hypothetical protein
VDSLMVKAVSQLQCPHKDRKKWFSLGENHERRRDFGLYQSRNRDREKLISPSFRVQERWYTPGPDA